MEYDVKKSIIKLSIAEFEAMLDEYIMDLTKPVDATLVKAIQLQSELQKALRNE